MSCPRACIVGNVSLMTSHHYVSLLTSHHIVDLEHNNAAASSEIRLSSCSDNILAQELCHSSSPHRPIMYRAQVPAADCWRAGADLIRADANQRRGKSHQPTRKGDANGRPSLTRSRGASCRARPRCRYRQRPRSPGTGNGPPRSVVVIPASHDYSTGLNSEPLDRRLYGCCLSQSQSHWQPEPHDPARSGLPGRGRGASRAGEERVLLQWSSRTRPSRLRYRMY